MSDDFNLPDSAQPAPESSHHSSGAPGQTSGQRPPNAYTPPQPGYAPPFAQVPAGFPYGANPYARGPMYAPRPPRAGWFWPVIILGGIALIGLFFWAVINSALHGTEDSTGATFNSSRIAVIDVNGVIIDAEKTDAQLRKYGDDASVKAIILHIDSPGGGAAASQEVYHEVLRIRKEKHKLVVASVESVGASGAYYIASACDRIYANDASVVGSIGVIMEWTNYGDLYRWAKLKSVVIHAGELKDAGDPTRDLTPKETAYFQSLVDNMYAQFIRDVADGRHTTPDKIQPLATGQVWTGEQSLGLGLIDKLGGYRTALIDTARQVGIKDEPAVIRPAGAKRGLAALINGDADELFPTPGKLLDRSPGFYFLWK